MKDRFATYGPLPLPLKTAEEITGFIEQEIIRLIRRTLEVRPHMATDPDAMIKGWQLTGSCGSLVATYNFIHGTKHTFEHWMSRI